MGAKCFSTAFLRAPSPQAPTILSTGFPPTKTMKVGIPKTPKLAAMSGPSSTFRLANSTLPENSALSLSNTGRIVRHGPHHSAQKSTTAGFGLARTTRGKSRGVTQTGPLSALGDSLMHDMEVVMVLNIQPYMMLE